MNWTEQKEQQFQSLLHERQNATRQLLTNVSDEIIEPMSYSMFEDADQSSMWESFINYESPFVVRDTLEQLEVENS